MKKVMILAALTFTFAAAGTAHANIYNWRTCYSGDSGLAKARGHVWCYEGPSLLRKFRSHVQAMEAGDIVQFYTRAAGRTWDCYYAMHVLSSTWDCFAGHPTNAEFKFISTVGEDGSTRMGCRSTDGCAQTP
jgi:hypothetical protein